MFDIIVNPNAGKGKGSAALLTVETMLIGKQIPYAVHKTRYAGHAFELAKEINKKKDARLIVMGGDGTFNEVLNGIENFDIITVGFIPCGTGNDYIKATSIPRDTKKALELILKNDVSFTDFIQLDNKRALNCAGAGMDVDVLIRYESMKMFSGKFKYFVSLIDVLLHLRFHKMKITIDGEVYDKSVFMIAVANGKYIGGGMPISPESDVNDGLFNLIIINEIKPRKVFGMLLKFLKGKHIKQPCTESFLCKEVKIELLDDGKTQVDGEVFDNKILNCKIMHNILRTYR